NGGHYTGSTPDANATEHPARPANKETKIFILTTALADEVKLISFSKDELYVTIHEKPTAKEKNDCANAYNNDSAVKLEKSGLRKNSTHSIAPSNVIERINYIIKKININITIS